jgi:uncharacterized membrane protein YgcG
MKILARVLLGVMLVSMFLAGWAFAAPQGDEGAYTITNYVVDMKVLENRTYDITETILVHFTAPRHGIIREIPFKGTLVRRVDVGPNESKFRASVKVLSVEGYDYTVKGSGDYMEVKIGNADTTVDGDQTYKIHYTYAMGNDNIKEFDEVYQNLIGLEWYTTIARASFRIEMPSDFDAKKLAIFAGGANSADPEAVAFQVDGNVISGQTTRQLESNEGITMRLELPNGYFTGGYDPRAVDWTLAVLIVIMAAIGIMLFMRYGRDQKPVVTVEFYPPEGMNSAELGYVFDGRVDTRDIVSLLMYWAHKGYLTIEQFEKDFILNKVKEMGDEAKPVERHMFNALFKGRETVTTSELKFTFYKTVESTSAMLANSFTSEANRVFTKASTAFKPLVSFMAALPVTISMALFMWRDTYDFMSTAIATGVTAMLILLPVFGVIWTMRYWRSDKKVTRAAKLIAFLLLSFIAMLAFTIVTAAALDPLLVLSAVLGTILLALSAAFISKRTPKGVEWLGKALGLRDFIERAERDKLIAMVQQDPNYFYYVLPYAYVLGITDKWAKNFEGIALQPPDWYQGSYHNGFSPLIFASTMNHSMSAFHSGMTARPQSGGSGGFGGGGGFSGGGGGGGGGGSW